MASRDEVPGAIEGLQILVCGLDIKPSGRPIRFELIGIVYPFDVKRRGDGTLERELSPKIANIRPYSLLDEGDTVSGRQLWGFSSAPIKRDDINVGQVGRSGSHSGQDMTCRGFCFLEIVNGWRGTARQVHPSQDLLLASPPSPP